MELRPVGPGFATEVLGVDLSAGVSRDLRDRLIAELHENLVLIFPGQSLSSDQHIAFSREFGELFVSAKGMGAPHPELTVFGNATPQANAFTPPSDDPDLDEWHADHSCRPTIAMGGLLYARIVPPEGGDTLFANMRRAYDDLPDDMKRRIDPLRAVHSAAKLHEFRMAVDPKTPPLTAEERAKASVAEHPLVWIHPVTGRKSLFIGAKCTTEVIGLSQGEGDALIKDLVRFATQPKYVYRHRWTRDQLLFWDNRSLAHTGTSYDRSRYSRLMQRTTVLQNERTVA